MVSVTTRADLVAWFRVGEVVGADLGPSWNVAPGRDLYVVAPSRSGLRLGTMKWGLVPSWSTDPGSGPRPINARAESLLEKPMFADAVARRRCIVPADGFYEWDRDRLPFHLASPDGTPLAFAGLWDRWSPPEGEPLLTVAVVTTAANPDVAPLHDRMPAVLPPSAWSRWLDGGEVDGGAALSVLRSPPAGTLVVRPASRSVNNVANDGPDLLVPAEPPARRF